MTKKGNKVAVISLGLDSSENYKIMDLTHEKMVDIVLFWKYMVCMAYLMALGMFLII